MGVDIDQQGAQSPLNQQAAQGGHGSGLSHPSLLIGDGPNPH